MPAIVPKTFKQMQADFAALISRLASEAHRGYLLNLEKLYLVGRMGKDSHNCGIWMELALMFEDQPPPWVLVRPQHIPRDKTVDQLEAMFREWLKSEPLYIFAD